MPNVSTLATPDLSYIIEPLRQFAVPLDSIIVDPQNARKHDAKNLGSIRDSMKAFGQRLPIFVQTKGRIVRVGNGRTIAARELGWSHIAAIVHPDADEIAKAFGIADNRTSELAEWDYETLTHVLADIKSATPDLLHIGWDDSDLQPLLRSTWAPPELDLGIGMEEDDGSFEGANTQATAKTRTANNIRQNKEYRTLLNSIRVMLPGAERNQDVDIVLSALRAYKRALDKKAAAAR